MVRGACDPVQMGYKELDMTEQLSAVFQESVTCFFFFFLPFWKIFAIISSHIASAPFSIHLEH